MESKLPGALKRALKNCQIKMNGWEREEKMESRLAGGLNKAMKNYRKEMDKLKNQKRILNDLEDAVFGRFLARCKETCDDCDSYESIGNKVRELKGIWDDLDLEKPKCLQNPNESIQHSDI